MHTFFTNYIFLTFFNRGQNLAFCNSVFMMQLVIRLDVVVVVVSTHREVVS